MQRGQAMACDNNTDRAIFFRGLSYSEIPEINTRFSDKLNRMLFNNLVGIISDWNQKEGMPGTARLNAPGALHHVMIRGIERRKIFRNNKAVRTLSTDWRFSVPRRRQPVMNGLSFIITHTSYSAARRSRYPN